MRNHFKSLFISLFLLLLSIQLVQAQECEEIRCDDETQDSDTYQRCLKEKKSCLESKISEVQTQKVTLTNTISVLSNQVAVQQVQINQSESELQQLERQVTELNERITGLNVSLDRLTTMLIRRIQTQYKQTTVSPLQILASADSFPQFYSQFRYLQKAGQNTAEAMGQAETQRITFDEQKLLKEQKQAEIEEKQSQLEQERARLASQRQEQNQLLQITQNDERKYQDLLEEANRQLAAFSRFVTAQGGASLLGNQTKCDDWGCYYSQRDSSWGSLGIGASSSSMAEYGCLVTSMAMVASHNGKNLSPSDIAVANNPFVRPTAYMIQGSWTVKGVTMSRSVVGYGQTTLDNELSKGQPVVVGIGSGPDHFVVIKEKKDGKYIMHDPFTENGHDMSFTDKYSLGSIRVDRVSVQ